MVSPMMKGHNTTLIQEIPWFIAVQYCIMAFGHRTYRYRHIRENSRWKCNTVDFDDVTSSFPKNCGLTG